VAPWHPNVLERPVDQVVHTFGAWAPLHLTLVAAVILALFGAAGLFTAHNGHSGHLAKAGLIVEVVGGVAAASLFAAEAIVFPVLADHAPTLLALDGPLVASPLFIGVGVLALGWPLGLSLLGLAAARSGVLNRTAGILLAVSGPLFLGLAGPFVPVAGALATVTFGGGQIWCGLLLWRAALMPPPTST
jgi:hypothetical protein